jgi:manganese/zinc/iron transport system substrate-binding protein
MDSRTLPMTRWIGRLGGLAAAWTLLLAAGGCGEETAPAEHRYQGTYPIKAVCTVGMVTDIVRQVGGEYVDVQGLMGEGTDPHLYKASLGDVGKLYKADIVFYSGLHLEGKMAFILHRLGRGKPAVAVTDGIPLERLRSTEIQGGSAPGQAAPPPHEREHADPHVWFDVSLWSLCAQEVCEHLAAFDPAHADDYRRRAAAYRNKLGALDAEAKAAVASIPEDRRVMVTAHDAFGYFGRAYGIEVRGIQGISTESEAGVWDVNALVDFIVRRRVKAVFVESSVSDRNMGALLEGCRAHGHELTVGGELFSDAMGKSGTDEGTYLGMIRHNVHTIVEALR